MSEVLELSDIKVTPGELNVGSIKVIELQDGTKINLPIIRLKGVNPGPTLLLISTVHGGEIVGIEVIRRLTRKIINPKELSGEIIALPVANPLAFQHFMYVSPHDNFNLANVFPGNPKGRTTHRIADKIWKLAKKSDYVIDMHASTALKSGFPMIYVSETDNIEIEKKALKMAEAFGITIVRIKTRPTSLGVSSCSMLNGIPAIMLEFMDTLRINELDVEVGVRGILNVMKSIGMLKGSIEKQVDVPIIQGKLKMYGVITTDHGGIIHLEEMLPGEKILKDTVIAHVYDVYGKEIETVKMPVDGYIYGHPLGGISFHSGIPAMVTGDQVALIFCEE